MYRKWILLVSTLLVLILAVAACAAPAPASDAPADAPAADAPAADAGEAAADSDGPFRIAIVMPSSTTDIAWSQAMYDALVAVQTEMGGEG
ncbi:MAG: hypothetical protein KDE50_23795, partial [Caldilineaceae bacterium]|nr:hypothetical protein [Caldilineaceae bacterium]